MFDTPAPAAPLPSGSRSKSTAIIAVASLFALAACGDEPLASPVEDAESTEPTEESPSPTEDETEEAEPEDPDLPSNEDLESFVEAMGSASPDDIRAAEDIVVPGSPAQGYLRHLEHLSEADRDAGYTSGETATITAVDDGFEMCLPQEDDCVGVFRDFVGEDGQIYSFNIDDRAMDDVIVMGDGSVIDGPNGTEIEFITAYENAAGTHLIFNYMLRSGSTGLMAPHGSYRSPSGRQSQTEMTNGAWELSPDSMSHYSAIIPGGEIGGEMHLNIIDSDGYELSTVTVPAGSE